MNRFDDAREVPKAVAPGRRTTSGDPDDDELRTAIEGWSRTVSPLKQPSVADLPADRNRRRRRLAPLSIGFGVSDPDRPQPFGRTQYYASDTVGVTVSQEAERIAGVPSEGMAAVNGVEATIERGVCWSGDRCLFWTDPDAGPIRVCSSTADHTAPGLETDELVKIASSLSA